MVYCGKPSKGCSLCRQRKIRVSGNPNLHSRCGNTDIQASPDARFNIEYGWQSSVSVSTSLMRSGKGTRIVEKEVAADGYSAIKRFQPVGNVKSLRENVLDTAICWI